MSGFLLSKKMREKCDFLLSLDILYYDICWSVGAFYGEKIVESDRKRCMRDFH